MKYISIFLICAFANQSASALIVRGSGGCGQWVEERQGKTFVAIANERWIVGYLSGLAMGTGQNILAGKDNSSIYLWMDNYCKANPLKKMADGAEKLFEELAGELGKK